MPMENRGVLDGNGSVDDDAINLVSVGAGNNEIMLCERSC